MTTEEYLSTTFRPDCDYVDGAVLERNIGEREHSLVQRRLVVILDRLEATLGVSIWPGVRVQVSPSRFRVPDLCVYRGLGPTDAVFGDAPFLCIEILSPEDRMSRMEDKLEDYFSLGVELVWVIDPLRCAASIHTRNGSESVRDGFLRAQNPTSEVALSDLFRGPLISGR